MSSEDPWKAYKEYCEGVESAFQKYLKTHRLSSLPNIQNLWIIYPDKWDIDTFLKPIIEGCKNLVYEHAIEGSCCKEVSRDLKCILEDIKKIQDLGKGKIDLSFLVTWLGFHILRLKSLTLEKSDIDTLNEWLRKCYNLEDRITAYFFTFYQFNRDQEMRHLVFDKQGQVREFFHSDIAPWRFYVSKLVEWFLRRYDLVAASALLNTNSSGQVKPDKTIQAGLGRRLPGRFWEVSSLSILIFLFLFVCAGGYLYEYQPSWGNYIMSYIEFPLGNSRLPVNQSLIVWFVLPYQVGILILITVFIFFLVRRLMLSRLLAGILVGYIPLLTAADPWKWLLRMPTIPALFIFIL